MREQQVPVRAKLLALLFLSLLAVLLAPSGCATTTQDQPEAGPLVEAGPPNPCGPGTAQQCNGVCIDVQNDTQNCGSCGTVCSSDKVCSHGACAAVCGGGTAHCGNNCVDLKSDPLNCGGCGTKCPSGEVCNKTACALTCQSPLTDCNGGCVDTTSDDFNCGACGNACPGGKSCVNSTCEATCQSGWSSCSDGTDGGTTCVDTTNDPNNCNSCGNKCPTGYFCQNGTCGIQCAGGTTNCSNKCIDESIDKNNCGGCGTTCTTGYSCSNAHCCAPATPVYCGGCDTFSNCVLKSGGRISASYYSTCAINAAGATYCWGYNSDGEAGTGSSSTTEYNTAQPAQTLTSGTLMVSSGEEHHCAINGAGAAYCWGYGSYGQLGQGAYANAYSPTAVSGISSGATRAAGLGYYASCFLVAGGAMKCTGFDDYDGLLCNGTSGSTEYNTPAATKITSGAINLSAGSSANGGCAIVGSGTVQCWGEGPDYGSYSLGDNATNLSATPVAVTGISNAVAVATGYYNICVVMSDGTMKCWGYGGYGNNGDGTTNSYNKPTTAATVTGVVQACTGEGHTCVVTTSGAVQCVGYNYYGQLGNGSSTNSTTWVTPIASGAVGVTCGYLHTCAIMSSGKAECWGYNVYGQVGNGTYTTSVTSPAVVQGF